MAVCRCAFGGLAAAATRLQHCSNAVLDSVNEYPAPP